MRSVVVGAGGYIGGHVTKQLIDRGHEVWGTFRTSPGLRYSSLLEQCNAIYGDVTEASFVSELVALEPDLLIYCVSLNHFESETNPEETFRVNVAPLAELTRQVSAAQLNCPVIYLSTLQVLGVIEPGKIVDERTKATPANLYGLTHLTCEEILALAARRDGLRSVSLRVSNVYGPPEYSSSQSSWLVLNDFCRSAIEQGTIVMKSDGSDVRDFVYVEDVAEQIAELSNHSHSIEGAVTFNLGSGDSTSIANVAMQVQQVAKDSFGLDVGIVSPHGSRPDIRQSHEHFKVMTSALNSLTGHVASTSVAEGIALTLEHYHMVSSRRGGSEQ